MELYTTGWEMIFHLGIILFGGFSIHYKENDKIFTYMTILY